MLLLTACTDALLDGNRTEGETDGIGFGLSVTEQADFLYEYGRTRSAGTPLDSATMVANTFGSHHFEGDALGLQVHRMALPLVGIHPKSVPATTESDTRASVEDIVSDALSFHDSLTIWGYAYNTTSPYTAEEPYTRTLFDQILLKKIRGWRSSVHWPYDDGKAKDMRFFALAPSLENMDIQVMNTPAYNTPPSFKYVVPRDVAAQRDLLFGYSNEIDVQAGPSGAGRYLGDTPKERHLGDDDKVVSLQFRHILTAVRFAQGNMPTDVTIRNIQLLHIKSTGTYTPSPATPSTGSWAVEDAVFANYAIDVRHDVTTYGSNAYIDGGQVMFLMPQTLGSEAQLVVTLQKDGELETRTIRTAAGGMTGDLWAPGYTVTYKITIGELSGDYYLLVEPNLSDYETDSPVSNVPEHGETTNYGTNLYQQGSDSYEQNTSASQSGSFRIHSFQNYKNYSSYSEGSNQHHAVGWKVLGFATPKDESFNYATASYNLNDANAVVWLSSVSGWSSNNPGTSTEQAGTTGTYTTFTYEMTAQSPVYERNHKSILSTNNNVTDLNLSTHLPDGASSKGLAMKSDYVGNHYNTANCYIVNANGSYLFPAVYGNSYQNGSESVSNPGNIFLDHVGNPIEYANILKQVNNPLPQNQITDISNDPIKGITPEETAAGIKKKVEIRDEHYGRWEDGTFWTTTDITTEIIWQDVHDMFTDASLPSPQPTESTIGLIGFTVQNIQPGNCVIALKGKKKTRVVTRAYTDDAGTVEYTSTVGGTTYPVTTQTAGSPEVLWTWHIWATDEVYPNSGENVDKSYPSYANGSKIAQLSDASGTPTAQILPVNLGWVPDDMEWRKYEPREVWVKIAQTQPNDELGTNEVIYLKVRQEAKQDLIRGTSTVYQWGRPTALPMVNYINKGVRDIYGSSGSSSITNNFQILTRSEESVNYVPLAISSPEKMIKVNAYHWWGGKSGGSYPNYAFWNTTKTLYDPCPVGFMVPARDLFGTFVIPSSPITEYVSSNAAATTYSGTSQLNMWTDAVGSKQGGYFYTKARTTTVTRGQRTEPVVYIPVSSYYSGNQNDGTTMSTSQKDQSVGYLWTTVHSSPEEGKVFYFQPESTLGDSKVRFWEQGNVDALPIRPRKE